MLPALLGAAVDIDLILDGDQAVFSQTYEIVSGSSNAIDYYTWATVADFSVTEASSAWSITLSAPEGGYFQYVPPVRDPESGYTDFGMSFSFTWATDDFFTGPPTSYYGFTASFGGASDNFAEIDPPGSGFVRRTSSSTGGTVALFGNLGGAYVPGEEYTFESVTLTASIPAPLLSNLRLASVNGTNGAGNFYGRASTASQFEYPVQPEPDQFFFYVAPPPVVPEPAHAALAGGLLALLGAAVMRRRRG